MHTNESKHISGSIISGIIRSLYNSKFSPEYWYGGISSVVTGVALSQIAHPKI